MEAKRDRYGVPSILAVSNDETIALQATEQGALKVANNKKLKEVIRLNLGTSREKVLFEKSFNEITILSIDGKLTLYLDKSTEDRGLTIDKPLSIETTVKSFYISNGSGIGYAELWLWE